MQLTSPVFQHGERIPERYTCDGDRSLSPPLAIAGVPAGAQSLVLLMDDPDVPKALRPGGSFTHWVLFNIPPGTSLIPEGETVGVPGVTTAGKTGYTGPCPPPQYEPVMHRYFFKLYALDTMLDLAEGASRDEIEAAMSGHVIAAAELMGTYSRA